MNTSYFIKIALIIFLFSNHFLFSSNLIDKEKILAQAQKELPDYLNQIPAGDEMLYGFYNREEFEEAYLGQLFQVYLINARTNNTSYKLFTYNEYRIPVMVKGKFRALITVSQRDDEWHIVDFGAIKLAKEMGEIIKEINPASEDDGIFLRIYGPDCDFIAFKKNENEVESCLFHPLESANDYIEANNKEKLSFYDLTALFKLIQK